MAVKLKIPKIRQTTLGTCGPTSLIMVMSYLNDVAYSPKLEFELWRDAIFLPTRLTTAVGLAIAALKRGYNLIVFRENPFCILPKLDDKFLEYESLGGRIDINKTTDINYEIQKLELLKYPSRYIEINRKIKIEDIEKCLKIKIPPLVLINTDKLSRIKDNLTHWVVVSGIDNLKGVIYINDPEDKIEEIPICSFDDVTTINDSCSQALIIFKDELNKIKNKIL